MKKLPSGEEAYRHAYKSAMERIEGQGQDQQRLAKQALSWISHARRQLTPTELQQVLAVRDGDSGLIEDGVINIQDLVSWCAGLVTVDEESGVIRLVHYTTQQYFDQTKTDWFPDAESKITKSCITYLLFDTFGTGSCTADFDLEARLQSYPFYNYAANNWGYHGKYATVITQDTMVFLESREKLEASVQALMTHRRLQSGFLQRPGYSQEFPRHMSALHLVAFFGAEKMAKALLPGKNNIDEKDSSHRTPLLIAAQEGHESVVKLLLDTHKVDCNSPDEIGRTPLSYAAQGCHQGIVELLLNISGVDVDPKDSAGATPLYRAVETGHGGIVKLLLDTSGVNADSMDFSGRTPLFLAAMYKRKGIEKMLLNAIHRHDKDMVRLINTNCVNVVLRPPEPHSCFPPRPRARRNRVMLEIDRYRSL